MTSSALTADDAVLPSAATRESAAPASAQHASLAYRADIDGLRAVAVMSVLLFHAGFGTLAGGYVGVDVFFVISGFLITSILRKEIVGQSFSISTFYVRRIRRIIPALLATMTVTTAAAFMLLLPSELDDFGRSGLAALASVSNIFFWATSDYFAAHAATQPLLHTWSLAVEEQYYLLLPPLLFLLRRRSLRTWLAVIAGIAAVSFVAAVITVAIDTSTAFYLPYSRAWELMLGSALAILPLGWRPPAWLRQVIGVVAVACIVGPLFLYGRSTPFPGMAALPPCLGAAALIWLGGCGGSLVNRGLSLPPAVFIGKISYSLYLVHWPLIVFQQSNAVLLANGSLLLVKVVLVLASLALGVASWWIVERPFRRQDLFSTRRLLIVVGVWSAVLLAVFGGLVATKGWPERFPPQAREMASWLSYEADPAYRGGKCFIASGHRLEDYDRKTCLTPPVGKPYDVLVGDSHAAQLWSGLAQTQSSDVILQATATGCKPVLKRAANAKPACDAIMGLVYDDFLKHNTPRRVIIAARWRAEDMPGLVETVRALRTRGLSVVLVGPIVEYDAPLPRLIARALTEGKPHLPAEHRVPEAGQLDKEMRVLARREGVSYVSTYQALCSADRCVQTLPDGSPVQFDYGHLTKSGSAFMARRLEEQGLFR